jgi:hypothetical protein
VDATLGGSNPCWSLRVVLKTGGQMSSHWAMSHRILVIYMDRADGNVKVGERVVLPRLPLHMQEQPLSVGPAYMPAMTDLHTSSLVLTGSFCRPSSSDSAISDPTRVLLAARGLPVARNRMNMTNLSTRSPVTQLDCNTNGLSAAPGAAPPASTGKRRLWACC